MDPYNNQRSPRDQVNRSSTKDPRDPTGGPMERRTPSAADREPQYSSGFTQFPPNQTRRQEIQTVAQRGEEVLQRVREQNRVQSVHVNPERLGGGGSLAEAREKTYRDSRSAKIEKKLKQEEKDKKRRQEEEEALQKMKDHQRQKAERLKEKNQQEERRRSEELREDHLRTRERFLQSLKGHRDPDRLPSSSATHASSRSKDMESRRREAEPKTTKEVQLDHERVNMAFLDKLEGRGREETVEGTKHFGLSPKQQNTAGHDVSAHLEPERTGSDWTDEEEPAWDCGRALRKLVLMFPNYSEDVLQDILDQCSGDYQTACDLLTG